jgi:signal transduction histidine kinase
MKSAPKGGENILAMRRNLTYALLAVIWLAVAGWQTLEHQRMLEFARKSLASRAHDLSAALSVVIRSQGRIAIIPKPRLEAALRELTNATELRSVMLLNATGEVVASAGPPMVVDTNTLLRTHEYWTRDAASFANLVALGPGTEGSANSPAILPLDLPHNGDERGGARSAQDFLNSPFLDPLISEANRRTLLGMMGDAPLSGEQVDTILGLFREDSINEHRAETLRRTLVGRPLTEEMLKDLLMMALGPPPGPPPEQPPEQPPWMNKPEYERLVQEHGVHWFLVTIPTDALRAMEAADLRLRGIVLGGTLLACLALALAWRAFRRSSELEIQLVRAGEISTRLRELNVTAAGLVHETKNPLNLIRGMSQMIGRGQGIPDEVRETAAKITEEADRVAGRLNQFLAYARPVQPHPKRIELKALVQSMFDVLSVDREEKGVVLEVTGPQLFVSADEDMLRQTLFNLLINAVQAVPDGGRVEVRLTAESDKTARMDVRDNGPGVPERDREAVFRPYVTNSEHGTGLGLAVVRQIALAHHWEVTCDPSDIGAVFAVRGIALDRNTERQET